ncbi:type III-B CRISPR module-associated protein Cmr5 [Clostridium pasteurianum]|uniref:type III-B CRISPR module-associated protein Cmr5 n=1 Tax=Clostridium pasteurianum TaxID=1501 RepID=UPI0022608146|nr:type III-B CRISPR module-associated protein Cmr5 [Clostridium pasteurianum]UZW14965.1 type III-B CRISPR module-associated protein Cmr5 [Clostridium pasteurianum]
MNRKQVEKLIPDAIKIIDKKLVKDGVVAREYNGYISSFGASIIQSGLLPTVAFYESSTSNSEEDRRKLTESILCLINKSQQEENKKLLDYVLKNRESQENIKEDIINAAIAIKLSLRTFKLKDKTN